MPFRRRKAVIDYRRTAAESGFRRDLGAMSLVLMALSVIVGTGIFILIAEAAQRAGPGAVIAFLIAGAVAGAAALCYGELGSIAPIAGGSYSYSYISLGEPLAWLVGWALVAEYVLGASAIAVGWSSYVVSLVENASLAASWFPDIALPASLSRGYYAGGLINLPAVLIIGLITGLLIIGTRVSVMFAIGLFFLKLAALALFVILAAPEFHAGNLQPFAPLGLSGIGAASASVFFAYLGFDGVASAAEETRDPQKNVPIGVVGGVVAATAIYMIVAAVAIGAVGGQPVSDAEGRILAPASLAFAERCQSLTESGGQPLACSSEALAYALRVIGHPGAGSLISIVVFLALPSAIVATLFGLSRLTFALGRDGLLPSGLNQLHPRFGTPVRMIAISGALVAIVASLFPIGRLADIANAGTLFAFFFAAVGLLILRRRMPRLERAFRLPAAWLIAGFAIAGCLFLFLRLPNTTHVMFAIWLGAGLGVYLGYGVRNSVLGRRAAVESSLARDAER